MKKIVCIVGDAALSAEQWCKATRLPAHYECRHFPGLKDLISYSQQTREMVSGFVCELNLLVKASLEEKTSFAEMLDHFPILRFQSVRNESLKAPPVVLTTPEEFNDFYQKLDQLLPRGIRKGKRADMHLNLKICSGSRWDSTRAFSATTRDVSRGGCFAVDTSVRVPTQEIFVKFNELVDQTAIRSRVARYMPWGRNSSGYPGWGIEFLDPPSHSGVDWINRLLNSGYKSSP